MNRRLSGLRVLGEASALSRAFLLALAALRSDRVRTRAGILVVALSMAVLVALFSVMERSRAAVLSRLEKAGLANLWLVSAENEARPIESGEAQRLAALVAASDTLLVKVKEASVSLGENAFPAPVLAVSGSLRTLVSARAREGRLLAPLDAERRAPYAVLGSILAERHARTAHRDALVSAGGVAYEVVGALESVRSEAASAAGLPVLDWDRALLVPLGAEPGAPNEPAERTPLSAAVLRFASPEKALAAARVLRSLPGARYGETGAVKVISPRETLRQWKTTRRSLDRLLLVVGALTALSAMLSISNLQSAAVSARTMEIGIRRSAGARSRDIALQFQCEALLLGLSGGALGLLAGIAASLAFAEPGAGTSWLSLSGASLLAGVAALIGLAAGILPARRASRIDPASALHQG